MPKETIMSASDFNLEKITTRELEDHIAATIAIGGNLAVFGRRGTGKTQIAKQQIKKAGKKEIYLNLSVLERVDMGGYPNIMGSNAKNKFVNFLIPAFYEAMLEGNEEVVALLDEVDKADPSLWAPLLEFTQFKSINGMALPNLKSVIMTGNLISEGGSRPSLPLLDRTEKYLVETDADAFIEWAGRARSIHPAIISFITDNKKDLSGAADPEDRYADASPRGWHNASQIITKGESLGWTTEMLNKKVCGCIGKSIGIRYAHYYDHYQLLLPMIDAVFAGKDIKKEFAQLEPSQQLVGSMILCIRFTNQLTASSPGKLPESTTNVGKFLKQIAPENILVAIRSQITVKNVITYGLDDHPAFKDVFADVIREMNE